MSSNLRSAASLIFQLDSASSDLTESQLEYIVNNSNPHIISYLLSFDFSDLPINSIVTSTVVLIEADVSMANLQYFQYSEVYNSKYCETLCRKSRGIFYNVLYRAVYRQDFSKIDLLARNVISNAKLDNKATQVNSSSNVFDIPDFPIDDELLQNIFGLHRCRIGVKSDMDHFIAAMLDQDIDITKVVAENIKLTSSISEDSSDKSKPKVVHSPKHFNYMFFLEIEFDRPHNQKLFPLLRSLLSSVKSNHFQKLVENIIHQDLCKIYFKKQENAGIAFVENLLHICNRFLIEVLEKKDIVQKIGKNKFPTFLYLKMIRVYQAYKNLIGREEGTSTHENRIDIRQYIDFVIKVMHYNRKRIFSKITDRICEDSSASNHDDSNTFCDGENSAEDGCCSLLLDDDGLSTLFDYIHNNRFMTQEFLEIIPYFFYYKNTHKTDLLRIMRIYRIHDKVIKLSENKRRNSKDTATPVMINVKNPKSPIKNPFLLELLKMCGDRSDEAIFENRLLIIYCIRDIPLSVCPESLRMVNFLVADFEKAFYMGNKLISEIEELRDAFKQHKSNINKYVGEIAYNCAENSPIYNDIDESEFPYKVVIRVSKFNDQELQAFYRVNKMSDRVITEFSNYVYLYRRSVAMDGGKVTHSNNESNIRSSCTCENPLVCFTALLRSQDTIQSRVKSLKMYSDVFLEYYDGICAILKNSRKLFLNRNVFNKLSGILNSVLKEMISRKGSRRGNIDTAEHPINTPSTYPQYGTSNSCGHSFRFDFNISLIPSESERSVIFVKMSLLYKTLELICRFENHAKYLSIKTNYLKESMDIIRKKRYSNMASNSEVSPNPSFTPMNATNVNVLFKTIGNICAIIDSNADTHYDDDVPDEFLDPLTCVLMAKPVILKTSNQTIDLSTFKQIMLNDQTDPFNRMILTEDSWERNEELEKRIQEYISKLS